MSATRPSPCEATWAIDHLRVHVADAAAGEARAFDVHCVLDPRSRMLLAWSVACAGCRELVIGTLREYRSADGSCSDELLEWASHVLGVSRKTVLRWLRNGPPPPARNAAGRKGA